MLGNLKAPTLAEWLYGAAFYALAAGVCAACVFLG